MEHVNEAVIQLIAGEVCNLSTPKIELPYSDEFYIELFNTAKAHDVAHIVGSALINNGLERKSLIFEQFRSCIYSVMFRYENQSYVFEKVCSVLEKEKIPYIPLKGSVIRYLYPQEWMRTGCDIDILVHERNVESATQAIIKELGYICTGRGKHDVSILSTENIFIELHFSLLEESKSPSLAGVLDTVWEHASPAEKGKYRYELDDAMFYFYHIAHMAKHFTEGGCGIRPFLDLWFIERSKDYHSKEVNVLLKKAGLTDFAQTVSRLSEVWFSGKEHDEITYLMQEYIFPGGCFGSKETVMLSSQQKSGGKLKYILSRVFVPYDELKGQYPILKKYRFLTPICEICRLFSLLFGKKKKFRKHYVNKLLNVPDNHIESINLLFESVGLK